MDIDRRNSGWGRVAVAAFRVPGFWFDFSRGAAGSMLLVWGTDLERFPVKLAESSLPLVRAALVGVAATASILITIGRFRRPAQAPAPVGFIAGLTLGLCPFALAALASTAAGLVAFSLKSLDAFFCALATVLVILGVWFDRDLTLVLVTVGLALVPPMASILWGRQLTLPFLRWSEF